LGRGSCNKTRNRVERGVHRRETPKNNKRDMAQLIVAQPSPNIEQRWEPVGRPCTSATGCTNQAKPNHTRCGRHLTPAEKATLNTTTKRPRETPQRGLPKQQYLRIPRPIPPVIISGGFGSLTDMEDWPEVDHPTSTTTTDITPPHIQRQQIPVPQRLPMPPQSDWEATKWEPAMRELHQQQTTPPNPLMARTKRAREEDNPTPSPTRRCIHLQDTPKTQSTPASRKRSCHWSTENQKRPCTCTSQDTANTTNTWRSHVRPPDVDLNPLDWGGRTRVSGYETSHQQPQQYLNSPLVGSRHLGAPDPPEMG
jgi:hypothetical protein